MLQFIKDNSGVDVHGRVASATAVIPSAPASLNASLNRGRMLLNRQASMHRMHARHVAGVKPSVTGDIDPDSAQ